MTSNVYPVRSEHIYIVKALLVPLMGYLSVALSMSGSMALILMPVPSSVMPIAMAQSSLTLNLRHR
ncbi:hypothetical protein C8J55DRAFT_554048 [Lentinula edodes]|uniref:Uncharacterized protein n=1 Tax=Lentinula lateritia TaxID=40482 RepID=A0A9W9B224_9AGAR|nr:hypothetical protein C8J55DRAFT_554048 [Lentinula edodes]